MMRIALASPPFPTSIDDGLFHVEQLTKEAAKEHADIICFPESYIPGYRGEGHSIEEHAPAKLEAALDKVSAWARNLSIAVIIPMDWDDPAGILNVAFVISNTGEVLGYQTKNQLDPTEDKIWIPGNERKIFSIKGVKIGIVICHEGFRYPETVRWAARHDAKIVFHPQFTGNDAHGMRLVTWGSPDNPYYEKAIMMRALENTIYFASVNYATKYPESATCIIGPDGQCLAHQTYRREGVLLADIDPAIATGLLAKRFKPELIGG